MKKITATKVSQALDISVPTLNNWYNWYLDDSFEKPKDMPELPMYEQKHERGTRYWNESDLKQLKMFQEWVPKGRGGVMGEYNARWWGKRGKRILDEKGIKDGKVYLNED